MYTRKLSNIFERQLFGEVIAGIFKPTDRLSTIEWAASRRTITGAETNFSVGTFDPLVLPYMEYVYECIDNPYIPVINSQKSARIGWTEVVNNWLGKGIEVNPSNAIIGFPTGSAAKNFAQTKWKLFMKNCPKLSELVNVGVSKNKESMYAYQYPNGTLRLVTLGSITNVKSDNIPKIVIEEPDDAKDNVGGQGSLLKNLEQRQKMVPKTQKKLVFGGTPTNKDFSRVEDGMKLTNQLVFKAECHVCKELIPMDGQVMLEQIKYEEFQDRRIDEVYGKHNPESAYFECPSCQADWSFTQKNLNIVAGKAYGFTDHTGIFSKGWHPRKPEVTEAFGFYFSELLSAFEDGSSFVEFAKDKILADIASAKGDETELKSYYNNRCGLSYAAGISSMEAEEMVQLRTNYPEGVAPYEGLIPFMGVDVQHNRFAIIQLAVGRNGNIFLVKWLEIFGNIFNWEDPVWQKLTDICLEGVTHITGKNLHIEGVSIDCQDGKTAELVYRWVALMNEEHKMNVKATRGARDLTYSNDDIYEQPTEAFVTSEQKHAATKAQTMGVAVYRLGTHKCQDEILRRIGLNKLTDENGNKTSKFDVFYFNEQSYGGFEEQMTSCRKLIERKGNVTKEVYRLVSGKHMDAMAATKNAFHSYYAARVREFTNEHWNQIESYIYN